MLDTVNGNINNDIDDKEEVLFTAVRSLDTSEIVVPDRDLPEYDSRNYVIEDLEGQISSLPRLSGYPIFGHAEDALVEDVPDFDLNRLFNS